MTRRIRWASCWKIARRGRVWGWSAISDTVLRRCWLRDLDALFIEANYCPDLLANDTKRPWGTKQRIASRHGHLSNEQCAEIVAQIALPRLRRLLLGHLSSDCNCPDRAAMVIGQFLAQKGLPLPEIHCACQHEPTGIFDVTAPPLPTVEPVEVPVFGAAAMWQMEFSL